MKSTVSVVSKIKKEEKKDLTTSTDELFPWSKSGATKNRPDPKESRDFQLKRFVCNKQMTLNKKGEFPPKSNAKYG